MNLSQRKIKVCCFCEIWESGGIESFLYNVITHMDRSMLEIDLVAARLGESIFTKPLQELGVHFYQLSGSTRKIFEDLRIFQKILAERHYDVVHLNAYQGLSLAYLRLARKRGVPKRIAHSHNTALRKSITQPLKMILHRWARKRYVEEATTLWACSKLAAEYLFPESEITKRSYIFIPNGVDMQRFCFDVDTRKKLREKLGFDGKFVIGNVGRLCQQKNQDFLLDVFYEVLKHKTTAVLILVGEGPQRPMLEEKTKQLGIADRVMFYGTTAQVEQLYWVMDVFVMPSQFEGLPVTGVEAQAAGLPCLFSKNITEECAISDKAVFLDLKAGLECWAEKLLKMDKASDARNADDVMNSSFDIQVVAEKIRREWTKE